MLAEFRYGPVNRSISQALRERPQDHLENTMSTSVLGNYRSTLFKSNLPDSRAKFVVINKLPDGTTTYTDCVFQTSTN
ncbi:hypothetical protein EBR96_05485 [bacterium]|nr:hypothetical protein [bacterium]